MSYATKRPVERRLNKKAAGNLSIGDIALASAIGYRFSPKLVMEMEFEISRLKRQLQAITRERRPNPIL